LEFQGQKGTWIDSDGALVLDLGPGRVTQIRPTAYQDVGGHRVIVEASYAKQDEHVIGFRLGRYDHSRPVVIDPVLTFSSFLGGSRNDAAAGVATDASGNIYIIGSTTSPNFPTAQALEPNYHGDLSNPTATFCHPFDSPFSTPCPDAFVTKLNPSGALIY